MTVVPYQKPGVPEEAGLTVEDCETAAWTFIPGEWGRPRERHRGAEAINMSLAVALRSKLPHLFYTLPGVRQLQDGVYDWVVRNRGRIPGDEPYCEQYPEECR
ncbi:MAG: DUF393 domain-containing protein [Rubrobacter sp.]|nr:DUF393 domain-containing protein [Rubrobacter sp.]